MTLRTSWIAEDGEGDGVHRSFPPPRIAKVKSIEATARILRPTRASLARATKKRLTGEAKLKAEARKVEKKRRELARVAKHNGRLTVPTSPKFQPHAKKKPSVSLLTMTSRELLEIDAIRERVQQMRKKTQQYHEATTRSVLLPTSSVNSGTSTNSGSATAFAKALRSSGGLGVPAIRRAKLTEPIGFDFEIDKRLASRKRTPSTASSTPSEAGSSDTKSTLGPPKRQRVE
ncbi:hypothetical protein FI667_g1635, partial [Globisporangium splendens]